MRELVYPVARHHSDLAVLAPLLPLSQVDRDSARLTQGMGAWHTSGQAPLGGGSALSYFMISLSDVAKIFDPASSYMSFSSSEASCAWKVTAWMRP